MRHHNDRTAMSRRLRLAADKDTSAADTSARPARARPALAVWSLTAAASKPQPRELVRQLIEHYSERGALVFALPHARETLAVASELGRRALPLTTRTRTLNPDVTPLRIDERAALVIAVLSPTAGARAAATLAARACDRLEAGGFLALALDGAHGPLGPIVRACAQQRLQYWQHVIAIDARQLANQNHGEAGADTAVRSLRCHHDLLVFRRPAEASVLADEAVNPAVAA